MRADLKRLIEILTEEGSDSFDEVVDIAKRNGFFFEEDGSVIDIRGE